MTIAPFPTTPILANFNIADEDPLSFGGAFSGPVYSVQSAARIVSNQAAGNVAAFGGGSYWNAQRFSTLSGIEIYFDMPTINGGDRFFVEFINNPNTGVENGYEIAINEVNQWEADRVDNGAGTALGARVTQAVSNGDGAGVRIFNGTIEMWYRAGSVWGTTPFFTRSDSTYTSLFIGFFIENVTNRLDNFGGGEMPLSVAHARRQMVSHP